VSDGVAAVVSELSGGLAVADEANEFSGGNGVRRSRPAVSVIVIVITRFHAFMSSEGVRPRSQPHHWQSEQRNTNTVIVVSFTIIAHRFSFKTPF